MKSLNSLNSLNRLNNFFKLIFLAVLILPAASAQTYVRYANYCGGVATNPTPGQPNKFVQEAYPNCTVTIYLTGTTTLAPIYNSSAGTATKPNPFTSDGTGYFFFYGTPGQQVDIQLTGSTITGVITWPGIFIGGNSTSGGGLVPPTAGSGLIKAVAGSVNTTVAAQADVISTLGYQPPSVTSCNTTGAYISGFTVGSVPSPICSVPAGGASLPSTPLVLKGNNIGGALPAVPSVDYQAAVTRVVGVGTVNVNIAATIAACPAAPTVCNVQIPPTYTGTDTAPGFTANLQTADTSTYASNIVIQDQRQGNVINVSGNCLYSSNAGCSYQQLANVVTKFTNGLPFLSVVKSSLLAGGSFQYNATTNYLSAFNSIISKTPGQAIGRGFYGVSTSLNDLLMESNTVNCPGGRGATGYSEGCKLRDEVVTQGVINQGIGDFQATVGSTGTGLNTINLTQIVQLPGQMGINREVYDYTAGPSLTTTASSYSCSGSAPCMVTLGTTVPVSPAYGTVSTAVTTLGNTVVTPTLTAGTVSNFATNQLVCIADPGGESERDFPVAVGTSTVTINMKFYHAAGYQIYTGGMCGYVFDAAADDVTAATFPNLQNPALNQQSGVYIIGTAHRQFFVLGSPSANTVAVAYHEQGAWQSFTGNTNLQVGGTVSFYKAALLLGLSTTTGLDAGQATPDSIPVGDNIISWVSGHVLDQPMGPVARLTPESVNINSVFGNNTVSGGSKTVNYNFMTYNDSFFTGTNYTPLNLYTEGGGTRAVPQSGFIFSTPALYQFLMGYASKVGGADIAFAKCYPSCADSYHVVIQEPNSGSGNAADLLQYDQVNQFFKITSNNRTNVISLNQSLLQTIPALWVSGASYVINSVAFYGTTWYKNTTGLNAGNPTTDTADWTAIGGSGGGGGSGVSSFNTRTGAVTLTLADITALGTLSNNISGNAATATTATTAATAAALSGTPTNCSAGFAPTGIAPNGNAQNCTANGSVVNTPASAGTYVATGTSSGAPTPINVATAVQFIPGCAAMTTGVISGPCITATGLTGFFEYTDKQTGTSYTIPATDAWGLVTSSNAGTVAWALPAATSATGFPQGYYLTLTNYGSGTVNVTSSSTIGGITGLSLVAGQSNTLVSDGTNWQIGQSTATGSGSGNVTGAASSTSGNVVSFNGTTGKVIQDTGIASSAVVTLTGSQTLTNKTVDGVTPTVMGYVDPTSSIQTQLNAKQGNLTLTTTGTSGAATLTGSTLNIPQYTAGSGTGVGPLDTQSTATYTIPTADCNGTVNRTYAAASMTDTLTTMNSGCYVWVIASGNTDTVGVSGTMVVDGNSSSSYFLNKNQQLFLVSGGLGNWVGTAYSNNDFLANFYATLANNNSFNGTASFLNTVKTVYPIGQQVGTTISVGSSTNITITPTNTEVHIGGTGSVSLMTPNGSCIATGFGCVMYLISDGTVTLNAGTAAYAFKNAVTMVNGAPYMAVWDNGTQLWYVK